MTVPRVVVANSGPLIALAKIGRHDLLHDLFERICIPQAVFDEVVVSGSGQPGAQETNDAEWITVRPVRYMLAVTVLTEELGLGESEAIVLAQELGADWILLDDALARRKAERIGLSVMGTLGILVIAKNAGIITAVKPLLDDLRKTDFRASAQVYADILTKAGEG